MKFEINNNREVLQVEIINTGNQIATVKTGIGSYYSYRPLENTETETIYQSIKFNIEQGEYLDCYDDNLEIEINGQLHTPVNGLITIPKQS